MKRKWIIEVISAMLLLLFCYAALSKLSEYGVFVFQVSESPFRLLAKSAHWIAWLIPATELVIAAMLPFTQTRLAGFYGASGLMFAFTVYIGAMLLSGLPLPCACGGIISALHWPGHLVFNIFFLCLSVTGIYMEKKNRVKVNDTYTQSYSMG
jgi:hypothetical protein